MSPACAELDLDREIMAGQGRVSEVVRARELLGLVGIEQFGVKAGKLAQELGKPQGEVTRWYRKGLSGAPKTLSSQLQPSGSIGSASENP